ncbi:MAG: chemotaxis protein CheX [Candidatus Saccharibacteria bacterium]
MDTTLVQPFVFSTPEMIYEMAGFKIVPEGGIYEEKDEIPSRGVASIINYVGKIKGRFLLDMDYTVALKLASQIMGQNYSNTRDPMVLAVISEINNTIAGDAITKLNRERGLSLRLTPPIVFTGEKISMTISKIPSVSLNYKSEFGQIKVNIAFERGL